MDNIFNFEDVGELFLRSSSSTFTSELDEEILAKLNQFKDLEYGWSYGEGNPINGNVIEKAKTLVKVGNFFISDVDAFAGTNGQVLIVFYDNDRCIEFTINEDLRIDAAIENGIGYDFEVIDEKYNITLKEAEHIIKKFKLNEWKSSDLFIINITTTDLNDFVVPHFQIHQMMEGFQSLIENVPSQKLGTKKPYVTTS